MSVQNGERLATKQDLADMYQGILPYLGGIVSSKAGFTPIGTIISVMGTTAPTNYLACDGTVYNIADYVELANYFNEQFGSKNFFGGDGTATFAVPDLRGEFLRGTGTNSHANQGSGADVGVHQDGTEVNTIYTQSNNNVRFLRESNQSTEGMKWEDGKISLASGRNFIQVSNGTYATETTPTSPYRYTTRPTNTSVLYCIATKNFYIDPTLDYSTEEKIVGTWIDGKPIYQKTITGISPSNAGSVGDTTNAQTYSLGANIDSLIKAQGQLHRISGGYHLSYEIGTQYLDNNQFFKMWFRLNDSPQDANTVAICVGSDWVNSPFYLTIQYTKTT